MNLINNKQRRPPKPPTPAQILQAKIDYLERTLEQVVRDTNAHIAAIEARANEEIKLSQQAQVDHDAQILAAWEESTRILLAENESLRGEVEWLKGEIKKLRRKTKQPRREIEE